MATTRLDQFNLSQDATFQKRVEAEIVTAALAIWSEASSNRTRLARKVLANPSGYAVLFAVGVATDANVAADAGSPETQANVTDAHIVAAVTGQWNAYALDV